MADDFELKMREVPGDILPSKEEKDPGFDEDHLSGYVLRTFRDAITDKEEYGWLEKRAYDLKSYYGSKDSRLSNWPWRNASNYPQGLTQTLLDTGHANIKASMWSNDGKSVKVTGVGIEDVRTAPILQDIMNWQFDNEIEIEKVEDENVFRTLLHGTGIVKVIQNFDKNSVKVVSLDIENVYVPIDASGFQVDDTDFVCQVVPLRYSDLQFRKALGVYKKPDEIAPGIGITNQLSTDYLLRLKDQQSGTSLDKKFRRDTYFILEWNGIYYPHLSLRPRHLIVWISPNGGRIQRTIENKTRIRPFGDTHAYPYPGRFYSMSLPEKIRNEQEALDYAFKQNFDAVDRAISPAMFVDESSSFNSDIAQRVPAGIYPKGRGNTIDFEPVPPVERGFEFMLNYIWTRAEAKTGIVEIVQGRTTPGRRTLGEQEIRSARADIRFSPVFDRFERGFKKLCALVHHFNDRYMDRTKRIKVAGYADFKKLSELFPQQDVGGFGLHLGGNFDFSFAGSPVSEQEQERTDKILWCERQMLNPLVVNDEGNLWRVTEVMAQAHGIRNVDNIIHKPQSAKIDSVEETLQRIMSGQFDIVPRPGIDTESYIFEIQLFMKTESFMVLSDDAKDSVLNLLRRVSEIRAGEMRALADAQILQSSAMARSAVQEQVNQNGRTRETIQPSNNKRRK